MTDLDTASIVSAIIAMARSLRLNVIAEGVEFTEQANFLRRYNCDQMQGYLVKPPVPAEEILCGGMRAFRHPEPAKRGEG